MFKEQLLVSGVKTFTSVSSLRAEHMRELFGATPGWDGFAELPFGGVKESGRGCESAEGRELVWKNA